MATSSGEQQIIELKDMISQLNTTIKELNKTIADQKAELAWFRNKMFGISSEKNKVPVDTSGQLSLFDGFIDIEEMEKPLEEIQPEYVEVKNCVRRKRTSIKTLFKDIPVRQVEVDTLSDEDKLCLVCGTAMVPIGKEVIRTELVITPPQLERIEYLATTYECPKCKETEDPQFIKDNGKPALIRGSYASDSLVAYVAYQKYDMFSPLYRQEKFFEELHAPINRTTMASWIIKTAETYIQPVYDYFHRE
ncbi:MAG: transposase, partial [Anaerovoracaceae bacterium]